MLDVWLIQHAEKSAEPGDPGLTARGRRQARAVADCLATLGRIQVYSSPLRRAIQTAEPVAAAGGGLPIVVDDRLRERMNWDGPGSGQDLDQFLRDWVRAGVDRDLVPRWGVSSRAAGFRLEQALRDVHDRNVGCPVAVVTHGGITVDFLRNVVGDRQLARAAPGVIENGMPGGAVTRVLFDGNTWTTGPVADIGHIPIRDLTGHNPT